MGLTYSKTHKGELMWAELPSSQVSLRHLSCPMSYTRQDERETVQGAPHKSASYGQTDVSAAIRQTVDPPIRHRPLQSVTPLAPNALSLEGELSLRGEPSDDHVTRSHRRERCPLD